MLVEPVSTVAAPAPMIVTLTGTVAWVWNDPAPTLIVAPFVAHASAPPTVANGLACDAAAHAGSLEAEVDTYSVDAACAAEAPAARAPAAISAASGICRDMRPFSTSGGGVARRSYGQIQRCASSARRIFDETLVRPQN